MILSLSGNETTNAYRVMSNAEDGNGVVPETSTFYAINLTGLMSREEFDSTKMSYRVKVLLGTQNVKFDIC
jgi:hypothetical protein